jgi:AcrR family transcriptional regulator
MATQRISRSRTRPPAGNGPRRRADEAAARRPGRPAGGSGDRTREQVLAAAVDTFSRLGLAGSSMRDIARKARIRVSSLYHYFPSKEALYREIQDRWQAEVRELVLGVLAQGLDLRETTRAMVGGLFDYFVANQSIARLSYRLNLDGESLFDGAQDNRWLGLAEGFLKPATLRGLVKEVDPVPFMVTIDGLVHWHVVHGSLYRSLLGRGLEDPETIHRAREHVIQVALRTLGLD